MKVFSGLFVLILVNCVRSQELNVIPDILRPYLLAMEEYPSFNLMANLSEVLFNIQQIGFDGPTILRNDYDFIIVGAGSAGSVLANRLSENKDWNILLLEAGKPESLVNLVPALAVYLKASTYNWDYLAEPTKGACLGIVNNQCVYPQGRALGGGSSVNYMIYTRGNRLDFDRWAEMGNEGWSYEDVLPYFKKSEKANLNEYSHSKYHSQKGELSVEYAPYRTALVDFYLAAARELGHDIIDYNGESQIGTGYLQCTTLNGKRHSSASAFIDPIFKKRKNLDIITSALVTKIIIDPETKTTLGVNFLRKNETYTVYAKKEVILSAGVFHSPQLLMLSGIGPEDQLEQIGVEVIKDLPVGKTMYDHMAFASPVFILNTTGNSFHVKKIGGLELSQFFQGRGPLTLPAGVEALSYGKAPNSHTPESYPDYELIFFSSNIGSDLGTGLSKEYHVSKEIYNTVFKPIESPELDTIMITSMQTQPKTKGRVYLRDNNIFTPPIFDYPFFEEEQDVEVLLAGVREAIRIGSTNVMKALGAKLHSIPFPGCEHLEFSSDDYWRCAIRVFSVSVHHQVSTCRMGPDDDEEAVVDPELRVRGVKRLRVADNSVAPTPVAAHTNALAIMIGEKMADILKKEHLKGQYFSGHSLEKTWRIPEFFKEQKHN